MQSNMRLVWMRIITAENLLLSKLNTLKAAKQETNAVGIPTQKVTYRLSVVCEPAHLRGKRLAESAHLNQIKIPTTRVGKEAGYSQSEDTATLRLTSELVELRVGYANQRTCGASA